MTLLLAFSMLAFPALGICVMELDNARKRRADKREFSAIERRARANEALAWSPTRTAFRVLGSGRKVWR